MFFERIENWKTVTAVFAAAGFIISIISGIIGRVGLGVLVFRALIFSVLFSGISLLIMFLIDKYLPELITSDSEDEYDVNIEDNEASTAKNTDVEMKGQNLDVTIEDDAGDAPYFNENAAEDSDDSGPLQDEDNIEEMQDGSVETKASPSTSEQPDNFIEDESSEELSSEELSTEELPDIGALGDSFNGMGSEQEDSAVGSMSGVGKTGGAEIMGGMHSTDEIAKAVQTVLKKDQEG
ncbi:MAG: hypothetical protein PQJ46_14025 [Spirochaetales bacterium]|nr:hypothetical protein [Spirochaetales bacterium]